jgi:GNAT superfamily N-acetyltransferase
VSLSTPRDADATIRVRRWLPNDLDACLAIVRALPDYFTDDVPDAIRRDLVPHQGWVADDGGPVGFTVVDRRSSAAAEILWAAVHPVRRGTGLGTLLIDHVLDALAAEGVLLVEAKTLDRGAGYAPYEATRAFWERRGFVQVDTIDPMPGWQPGSPCALYVAALATTRRRPAKPSCWTNRGPAHDDVRCGGGGAPLAGGTDCREDG